MIKNPGICELFGEYGILVNDDNELMFLLNGYFPGEPQKKTIYYNGGEDGILERNEGEIMLLDSINENVREILMQAEFALVKEVDSSFQYKAAVIHEDIAELVQQILAERDYPVSRKHPYPLHTGAYTLEEALCDDCNKVTKIVYRDRLADERNITVCPSCVWKIPKYKTMSPDRYLWPEHCGEEGVYLGRLREEDISKEMWMEYLKTWNYNGNPYPRGDAKRLREQLKEGKAEAHLFRCDECKLHYLYWIELA